MSGPTGPTGPTQVNITRTKKNGLPPWLIPAIAALILGSLLLYFLLQPKQQTPVVSPTVTPTASAVVLTVVSEVTSTPNLLTPSATAMTVEITSTAPQLTQTPIVVQITTTAGPTTPVPTQTARVVQVTTTAAPTKPTTVATKPAAVATTAAPAATTAVQSPTTEATATGTSVLTPSETGTVAPGAGAVREITGLLKLAPQAGNITNVTYDGANINVGFQITDASSAADAARTAREQIRGILSAMTQNTLPYTKLVLKGSSQNNVAIDLAYDAGTVRNTDWASVSDAQVYGKAQARSLQPPYDATPQS